MYLVARLFGVGLYTVLLFLVNWALQHLHRRQCGIALTVYWFILSVMAFFYVPSTGADLYSLFSYLHMYSAMSFSDLTKVMLSSNTPGAIFYYYLIGQLGNDGFLAGITAFIVYGLLFSIVNDFLHDEKNPRNNVALTLFIFLGRGLFQTIISGIRDTLAMAIIAWCVYQEFVKEKSVYRHIPLYVIAASIHVMGQAILAIRVVFLFFEKGKNQLSKLTKIILALFSVIVIFEYGSSFVDSFISIGTHYVENSLSGQGWSYFWEALLSFMTCLITIYLLINIKKFNKFACGEEVIISNAEGNNVLAKFTWFVLAVDLIAMPFEYNIFFRTSMFINYLDIPLGLYSLNLMDTQQTSNIRKRNLFITTCIVLFIACARGNLCSLKFWE